MLEDGIYRGIPFAEYLGWDAVSNSALSRFSRVPAAAFVPLEDSDTLRIGRSVHCDVLEPEQFLTRYRLKEHTGNSKEGRAEKASAGDDGVELISMSDYVLIRGMAESVLHHPAASAILEEGEAEVSLLWHDHETGLRCKARIDWLAPGLPADLKTTRDSSPAGFAKSVASLRYHVMQAHYRAGLDALGIQSDGFVFIAVEKTDPYPVGCYVESGQWPAWRSPKIETLSLPGWAMMEESDGIY
jgi:hypothetical protein